MILVRAMLGFGLGYTAAEAGQQADNYWLTALIMVFAFGLYYSAVFFDE